MRTFLFLIANGIAGFQDLAVGFATVALFSYMLGVDASFTTLGIGAILGVLPDLIDVVPQIIMGRPPKKGEDHHLTFFHRPLYMVTLVAFLGFLFDFAVGQYFWVIVAPLLVTYHYIHDTWSGIAWLYPFKIEYPIPGRGWVLPENCGSTPGHRIWINKFWYYGSTLARREVFIGSLALAFGAYLEYGLFLCVLAFVLPWLFVYIYWNFTKTHI